MCYVLESLASSDELPHIFTFFSRLFFVFCLLSTTLISEAKADKYKWAVFNVLEVYGENLYQGFIASEKFDSLKACESHFLYTWLEDDRVAKEFEGKIYITEWMDGEPWMTLHCEKVPFDYVSGLDASGRQKLELTSSFSLISLLTDQNHITV